MKFSTLIFTLCIAAFSFSSLIAKADNGELTGDTKLACDAILCLSSGTRPHECTPGITRYFSITHRKWRDTVNARRDFLSLCPATSDTPASDMPTKIESIAQGAGRCDAAYLNSTLARQVEKQVCPTSWVGNSDDSGCYTKYVTVISNSKPAYCSAYANNDNTYLLGVTYVGDPMDGGKWVNDSAIGQ